MNIPPIAPHDNLNQIIDKANSIKPMERSWWRSLKCWFRVIFVQLGSQDQIPKQVLRALADNTIDFQDLRRISDTSMQGVCRLFSQICHGETAGLDPSELTRIKSRIQQQGQPAILTTIRKASDVGKRLLAQVYKEVETYNHDAEEKAWGELTQAVGSDLAGNMRSYTDPKLTEEQEIELQNKMFEQLVRVDAPSDKLKQCVACAKKLQVYPEIKNKIEYLERAYQQFVQNPEREKHLSNYSFDFKVDMLRHRKSPAVCMSIVRAAQDADGSLFPLLEKLQKDRADPVYADLYDFASTRHEYEKESRVYLFKEVHPNIQKMFHYTSPEFSEQQAKAMQRRLSESWAKEGKPAYVQSKEFEEFQKLAKSVLAIPETRRRIQELEKNYREFIREKAASPQLEQELSDYDFDFMMELVKEVVNPDKRRLVMKSIISRAEERDASLVPFRKELERLQNAHPAYKELYDVTERVHQERLRQYNDFRRELFHKRHEKDIPQELQEGQMQEKQLIYDLFDPHSDPMQIEQDLQAILQFVREKKHVHIEHFTNRKLAEFHTYLQKNPQAQERINRLQKAYEKEHPELLHVVPKPGEKKPRESAPQALPVQPKHIPEKIAKADVQLPGGLKFYEHQDAHVQKDMRFGQIAYWWLGIKKNQDIPSKKDALEYLQYVFNTKNQRAIASGLMKQLFIQDAADLKSKALNLLALSCETLKDQFGIELNAFSKWGFQKLVGNFNEALIKKELEQAFYKLAKCAQLEQIELLPAPQGLENWLPGGSS